LALRFSATLLKVAPLAEPDGLLEAAEPEADLPELGLFFGDFNPYYVTHKLAYNVKLN